MKGKMLDTGEFINMRTRGRYAVSTKNPEDRRFLANMKFPYMTEAMVNKHLQGDYIFKNGTWKEKETESTKAHSPISKFGERLKATIETNLDL